MYSLLLLHAWQGLQCCYALLQQTAALVKDGRLLEEDPASSCHGHLAAAIVQMIRMHSMMLGNVLTYMSLVANKPNTAASKKAG
jgi:hypothetical protein